MAAVTGFSPSKHSHFSWSPKSGDSFAAENLARLDARSPDRLIGELHFLDDTITLTPEELSRAPAEVLGRSRHGTSYKATLENGLLLRMKWLREGVAKQRKEFVKETKKICKHQASKCCWIERILLGSYTAREAYSFRLHLTRKSC